MPPTSTTYTSGRPLPSASSLRSRWISPVSSSVVVIGILCIASLQNYVNMTNYFTPSIQRATDSTPTVQQQQPCSSQKPINDPLPLLSKMPYDVKEAATMISAMRKQQGSRATFVQIGANDGITNDLIYPVMKDNKTEWIGLLVEPQAVLFSSLKVVHSDIDDWNFYNGVMDDGESCRVNGTVAFCESRTPGQGNWYTQGQINQLVGADGASQEGSFRCDPKAMQMVVHACVASWHDLIYMHAGPVFHQYTMKRKEVSYNNTSVGIDNQPHTRRRPFFFNVDLVQIDTEGNDYHIIKMMDMQEELRPLCINYENTCYKCILSLEKREELREYLKSQGYTLTLEGDDTLACRVQTNTPTTATKAE